MKSIHTALQRLGYTQEWLDYGIISEDYVLIQYTEINVSKDNNAEHYRSAGFISYLSAKTKLTDKEIRIIFTLKDDGIDNCDLHEERVFALLHADILTDHQLEYLKKYPEITQRPLQKLYLRKKLIRKINQSSLVDCFDEVINSDDNNIYEYVLQRDDVNKAFLEWLSVHGNKRLRNRTQQRLNSKKFRYYKDIY